MCLAFASSIRVPTTSICPAIDKFLLTDSRVQKNLRQLFVGGTLNFIDKPVGRLNVKQVINMSSLLYTTRNSCFLLAQVSDAPPQKGTRVPRYLKNAIAILKMFSRFEGGD